MCMCMLAKLSADPGTVQQFGLVWLDAKLRARPIKAVLKVALLFPGPIRGCRSGVGCFPKLIKVIMQPGCVKRSTD